MHTSHHIEKFANEAIFKLSALQQQLIKRNTGQIQTDHTANLWQEKRDEFLDQLMPVGEDDVQDVLELKRNLHPMLTSYYREWGAGRFFEAQRYYKHLLKFLSELSSNSCSIQPKQKNEDLRDLIMVCSLSILCGSLLALLGKLFS